MVNVIDLIADQKSKARFIAKKSDAWEYFRKQKSAIDGISVTQGFKEIREYRAREVVASQERLQTVKSGDIKGVQAELRLAMRFLDFLENIKTAEINPLEDMEENI